MLKRQQKGPATEVEKARKEYYPDSHRQEVYLIDFGLSKKFVDFEGNHIQESKARHFVGTAGFSSLNSHFLIEQTRRDDLEGLAYSLLYMRGGRLPWHNITTA